MLVKQSHKDVVTADGSSMRVFIIEPNVPGYPNAKWPGCVVFSEIYQVRLAASAGISAEYHTGDGSGAAIRAGDCVRWLCRRHAVFLPRIRGSRPFGLRRTGCVRGPQTLQAVLTRYRYGPWKQAQDHEIRRVIRRGETLLVGSTDV